MKLVRSCSMSISSDFSMFLTENNKESDNEFEEQEARVLNDSYDRTRNTLLTNNKDSEHEKEARG